MSVFKSVLVGVVILVGVIGLAVYGQRPTTDSETRPTSLLSPVASASQVPSLSATLTPTSTAPRQTKNNMHEITIATNYGDIVFQTYDADAPKAAVNFVALARKGFYDNLTFHRVIEKFMIQGGDPNGNGTGGPGYQFADELNPQTVSYQNGYVRGAVAMANSGPNTNGSQFFIMHMDYALPHNYTIFGHVTLGQNVVDAIAAVGTDAGDRPLAPVVMKKVTVMELK